MRVLLLALTLLVGAVRGGRPPHTNVCAGFLIRSNPKIPHAFFALDPNHTPTGTVPFAVPLLTLFPRLKNAPFEFSDDYFVFLFLWLMAGSDRSLRVRTNTHSPNVCMPRELAPSKSFMGCIPKAAEDGDPGPS